MCADANRRSAGLIEPASYTNLPAVARYSDQTLAILGREQGRLSAVKRPPGTNAALVHWLTQVERRREITQSLAWAAHAGDSLATGFELVELRRPGAVPTSWPPARA